jgi:hypothetical protein
MFYLLNVCMLSCCLDVTQSHSRQGDCHRETLDYTSSNVLELDTGLYHVKIYRKFISRHLLRLQQWARAAQYSSATYIQQRTASAWQMGVSNCCQTATENRKYSCRFLHILQPQCMSKAESDSAGHVLTRNSRPERLRTWSFLPCHMQQLTRRVILQCQHHSLY